MYSIRRVFNPEIYQGKYKRKKYFEGWYFKIIDQHSKNIFAVIPGVSISGEGRHAFIQFIDANSGKTNYISFSINDFKYSEKAFDISIANNHFNKYGFTVDFGCEDITVKGAINYKDIESFPKSIFNPGIMGPFSFVPFMECHHGIINVHCGIEGFLSINNKQVDFTGGYGYVEKDWGSSFPHSWIWLQTNHFQSADASLMFSIANIPWLHTHFDGLIAFLRIGDRFYRFATYTRAQVNTLNFHDNLLNIIIEDSKYTLEINAANAKGGILKAPKKGKMDIYITESITASAEVILKEKAGGIIFSDTGKNTGLELAGDYKKFIK